jgi:hypothetical protein
VLVKATMTERILSAAFVAGRDTAAAGRDRSCALRAESVVALAIRDRRRGLCGAARPLRRGCGRLSVDGRSAKGSASCAMDTMAHLFRFGSAADGLDRPAGSDASQRFGRGRRIPVRRQ